MIRAKITLLIFLFMRIAVYAAKNGEKRTDYSFNELLVHSIIVMAIYYYAGILDFTTN